MLRGELPSTDLPELYRSVHCFVLPSRGEGWGRPHVEAMSAGLPVIATLWSGPEQYMTEQNSYPLRHDGRLLVAFFPSWLTITLLSCRV